MKFSIIIPVYNVEMYIEECLNSVLNQSFPDYEILLIDDGSTDNSGKICDWYAAEYQCVNVVHQENKGQAQARNLGIALAKGDYVLFLDGDDYWISDENLGRLAKLIQKNNAQWDIVAYDGISAYYDRGKVFYSDRHVNHVKENSTEGYSAEAFLKNQMKENTSFYWYSWGYAYSKRIFEDKTLRFPEKRKYEDVYLMWRILLKAQRIAVVPEKFYVYRRNRAGSTTKEASRDVLMDFLWVLDQNITEIEALPLEEELKSLLLDSFSKSYFSCCTLSIYLRKKERKEMLIALKKKRRFLEYAKGKKYEFTKKGMQIIGFENMFFLLYLRSLWLRYKEKHACQIAVTTMQ